MPKHTSYQTKPHSPDQTGTHFVNHVKKLHTTIKTVHTQRRPEEEWTRIVARDGMRLKDVYETIPHPGVILVITAVRQNGLALQYASKIKKMNPDIAVAAVRQNPLALQYVSDKVNQYKGIVGEAVRRNGLSLQFASDGLKNDKDIVDEAVGQHGLALQFAHERLRDDKDIVQIATQKSPLALEYASESLQNDNDIVYTAVRQDGMALQFASPSLKRTLKLALIAIRQNSDAYKFIDDSLKQHPIILAELVFDKPKTQVSPSLQSDVHSAMADIVLKEPYMMSRVPLPMLADVDRILKDRESKHSKGSPSQRAKGNAKKMGSQKTKRKRQN